MRVGYLSIVIIIGLSVVPVVYGQAQSLEAELAALEAEAFPAAPTMMPPMMPMIPMPTVMPIRTMIQMLAAMTTRAMVFMSAKKMLKKNKMMEKKMAKKAYKKGKMAVMARVMAGQMPQPADFINGRNEYTSYEFPPPPEFPSPIPLPGTMDLGDYARIFGMVNGRR